MSQLSVLSGATGSGKTTFLRILAGLEKANGSIIVDDEIWQDNNIYLSPQKRRIGFVFQETADKVVLVIQMKNYKKENIRYLNINN